MNIVMTRLMEEDLEVADNGISSLPTLADSTWFGDLDPALTGSAHTMVDIYAKRELGWGREKEGGGGRNNLDMPTYILTCVHTYTHISVLY